MADFERLLELLKNKTKQDNTTPHVLRLMRDEIEPQIKSMTKKQLIEAYTESIYAIYRMDQVEDMFWELVDEAQEIRGESLAYKLKAAVFLEELEKAPAKAIKESTSRAGSAEKKKDDKKEALELWRKWGKNPDMFKNKTEFCTALTNRKPGKKENYCSHNTARKWFECFRENHPQPSIEHLLPTKR
jgi:hypothetical protein